MKAFLGVTNLIHDAIACLNIVKPCDSVKLYQKDKLNSFDLFNRIQFKTTVTQIQNSKHLLKFIMATNQTAGQVPAYENVAPPAYNPSGQGASDAQPAVDNAAAISYPQIQGQENATPAAAPSGGAGGGGAAAPVAGQGMAMTQMLSNPNAPNVAQGQQVIYMMQQPDGTLVPLQNVQAVNGVATGVNVNSFGEGIQAPAPVVQPHAAVVQASQPGFILEAYYNTRMLSWGLLLLWIFYICQIYGSTVNELTVYDDGVHEWGFEYRTDSYVLKKVFAVFYLLFFVFQSVCMSGVPLCGTCKKMQVQGYLNAFFVVFGFFVVLFLMIFRLLWILLV